MNTPPPLFGIVHCTDPDHRHDSHCRFDCRGCDVLFPPRRLVDGYCTECRLNLVEPGLGCPACGQRHTDRLVIQDDDITVRCACGHTYEIA